MGIFGLKNNDNNLPSVSKKQFLEFSLPDSGVLLMPDFFWLKKNKKSLDFIEQRIAEILQNKDLALKILGPIKSLPEEILERLDIDSSNVEILEKIRNANIYGGLLAYIEMDSGQSQSGLVHPAIHGAMSMYNVFSSGGVDPNVRQGVLITVQAAYSKIRFPEIDKSQLLKNVYKLS